MGCLNNQDGFTLIEVMIAVTIFAVGLLAVASLQLSSITGNAGSQRVTETTTLGQEQIEKLMGLPYDHPDLVEGVHRLVRGHFDYSWEVRDDEMLRNTKTVELTVTYNLGDRSRQTRLVVVKSDPI